MKTVAELVAAKRAMEKSIRDHIAAEFAKFETEFGARIIGPLDIETQKRRTVGGDESLIVTAVRVSVNL